MCPASRATASSAARGSTSGSATSGMGTIEPSGFRTVIPPSHASRAASRPTCSSSPSSKMGPIVAPLAPPTALSCCVRGDSTSDVTKIYTKTGDAGQTGLLGGARVPKSDARVEAYGDVDELSSALGLARAHIDDADLDGVLAQAQRDLLLVAAELATPPGARVRAPSVEGAAI